MYSLQGYIDFSDTVELVGIETLDGDGNPVSGDVLGDGGFNYTTLAADNAAALGLVIGSGPGGPSVPEASSWAMLLTSLVSLGGAVRYRARSSAGRR